MSQHIDLTYVDNFVDQAVRIGFTGGIAGTDAVLVQMIEAASGLVDALITGLGYTPPSDIDDVTTSTKQLIQLAVFGAMLPMLYGRKGLEVPDTYQAAIAAYERLQETPGDADGPPIELPGLALDVESAVGGVVRPTVSTSVDVNAPAPVFNTLRTLY
jgi:hypothetical protein